MEKALTPEPQRNRLDDMNDLHLKRQVSFRSLYRDISDGKKTVSEISKEKLQ